MLLSLAGQSATVLRSTQDIEGFGVRFFMRIFELHPEALELFSFRHDKDLAHNAGLRVHGRLVFETVGRVVCSRPACMRARCRDATTT